MKQCPVCRTTYTDESLRFCLVDGAGLSTVETTAVSGVEPHRTNRTWLKAVVAVGVIGTFFLIATLVAVAILWRNTGGRRSAEQPALSSASPSATIDEERIRIQNPAPDVQRTDEDQPNNQRTNTKPFPDNDNAVLPTARVNSPKDGFLALRDIPNTKTGSVLLKIPHGSVVALNNCEKRKVVVDTRSGRWCQVEYSNLTGWVFDAWLDY